MPITSKRMSDPEDLGEEIMKDVGPDAEQRARMRAGPRDKRKPEPDFKDEAFAASVYQRFNSRPKPEDESPKREADGED